MKNLKQYLPEVLVIVLFALIAFAYFFPADIEGKILYRHDSSAGVGLGQEAQKYKEATGKATRWTNSAFGGMPTYQTAPSYGSTESITAATKAYHLWLPENVWYVFVYLLGFYILLRAFDFRRWMAALGAVVWAFSSYFFIIIAAGHIWKVWALAYLPPMIAGIVLAYRGKYLWGLIVTAIFAAFEVNANHVQMTYYYLFIIVLMALAWLVDAIRKGQLLHWLKATGVCLAAAVIGIGMNASTLYHTWQYSQESMRGKSELVKANSANQTSSGLERDYITDYSYGIGETWSLLIPNVKGGASDRVLGSTSAGKKQGSSHYFNTAEGTIPYSYIYDQMPMYWNESTLDRQQPGTSGPVYVGAFVLMLFVLGLFIVRGPLKWALLIATLLSIMLAWGQNYMPLTNFFIDYVPMYAKFRTVESILVIAEFCIPLLAMLALKEFVSSKSEERGARSGKALWASFALTAVPCLLFALMPGLFFNFTTNTEVSQFQQMLPQDQLGAFMDNLQQVRRSIFTADCWRSLAIIVVGMLLLLLYRAKKLKQAWLMGALIVLCLLDMWTVNKRYLSYDMFVPKSEREAPQQLTKTDEMILQDTTAQGNYRVLNMASNTFNENETSYYHKSIGGYHAAKLRRYQEMIEHYIMPEMQALMPAIANAAGDMTKVNGDSIFPVLNMLNTRYIIMPLQGGETVPVQNPYVYGNAWFVDKISYVDNANAEIDAIKKLNLRHEAVADKRFEQQLGKAAQQDATSLVTLVAYEPNHLTYDVESGRGGIIVFSENYYPGWTATIDGQPAELGRVNYILRALNIAAGKHKVELMFYPKSLQTTETIAYIALALLLLAIAVACFVEWKKKH
ncbi:MAG: YfhO family protein [Prevotella sp.]|nr:YfhO family protein [Prevotella sp.]